MKKTCLLLSMVLFACGSEASEGSAWGPTSDPARVPGAGGSDGTGVPASNDLGASQSAEGSGALDVLPTDVDPTSVPAPDGDAPTADDPAPTTDDGSGTDSDPATDDGSGTDSDPAADDGTGTTDPATDGDAGTTDPTTGDGSGTTDPTTDNDAGTTDPCALTYSGKSPSGKSYGSGSQDGEGSSTWACGGPQ